MTIINKCIEITNGKKNDGLFFKILRLNDNNEVLDLFTMHTSFKLNSSKTSAAFSHLN